MNDDLCHEHGERDDLSMLRVEEIRGKALTRKRAHNILSCASSADASVEISSFGSSSVHRCRNDNLITEHLQMLNEDAPKSCTSAVAAFVEMSRMGSSSVKLSSEDHRDDNFVSSITSDSMDITGRHFQNPKWFEEQLETGLKWSFAIDCVMDCCKSKYHDIAILDTKRFGNVHESLVHPALLLHDNHKTAFVMCGCDGSTAREVLKHKTVEKVIICDIDKDLVDTCKRHLKDNRETFSSLKLHVVINDPKAELETRKEKFNVIIGDLADSKAGGLSTGFYTKSYQGVIKPSLNANGIFVTQAGPAGVLSHKEIFSPTHNTMEHAFKHVIACTAHVPSYADCTGWILGSDKKFSLDVEMFNKRINERIEGQLRYLDGPLIVSFSILNKTLYDMLMAETRVFTEEISTFDYGRQLEY